MQGKVFREAEISRKFALRREKRNIGALATLVNFPVVSTQTGYPQIDSRNYSFAIAATLKKMRLISAKTAVKGIRFSDIP